MKGKIDENGWLNIERAGEMKEQECPFANMCGDWCPLFGEPDTTITKIAFMGGTLVNEKAETRLKICRAELLFDEFSDERVTDESKVCGYRKEGENWFAVIKILSRNSKRKVDCYTINGPFVSHFDASRYASNIDCSMIICRWLERNEIISELVDE